MKMWLLAGALALASAVGARADDYPVRPITVIVPFPAGGPTDAIIRNLGERMRMSLGQPLIVEYVTGAGGTVGTRAPSAPPPTATPSSADISAPSPPMARSINCPTIW